MRVNNVAKEVLITSNERYREFEEVAGIFADHQVNYSVMFQDEGIVIDAFGRNVDENWASIRNSINEYNKKRRLSKKGS